MAFTADMMFTTGMTSQEARILAAILVFVIGADLARTVYGWLTND